jgi:hypothetical protein
MNNCNGLQNVEVSFLFFFFFFFELTENPKTQFPLKRVTGHPTKYPNQTNPDSRQHQEGREAEQS